MKVLLNKLFFTKLYFSERCEIHQFLPSQKKKKNMSLKTLSYFNFQQEENVEWFRLNIGPIWAQIGPNIDLTIKKTWKYTPVC